MNIQSKIRSLLYEQHSDLSPVFNPETSAEGDVVDLTFDVSNHTKFYHNNTDEVRALLAKAKAIVTDNPHLAQVMNQFNRRSLAAPFGFTTARDASGPFSVGLLNYDDDTDMANVWMQPVLRRLDRSLLVYGYKLGFDIEQEVIEDLNDFAGRCDVLLLPGIPQTITSLTLPLSVMAAGTIVLATSGGSWHALNPAAGVMLMPPDRKNHKIWKSYLDTMERDARKVDVMKERNIIYVKNLNAQSRRIVGNLAHRIAQFAEQTQVA